MSSEGDYAFQVTANSTDTNNLPHVRPLGSHEVLRRPAFAVVVCPDNVNRS
jgi:hypothetical protein